MTKTQALQRLYKALTGNEGRNTGSKVIEDLAVAAENGEIGGGGKVATVSFVIEDGMSGSVSYPQMFNRHLVFTNNMPFEAIANGIDVPVIQDGTVISIQTDGEVILAGGIELLETVGSVKHLNVSDDATITVGDPK